MNIFTIELLGWVSFSFILIGYYLNAKLNKKCFYFWVVGNLLYSLYGIYINAFPIIATSILVLGMNVYGFKNWNNINK
tara:strand:- start:666 stop:899 length:234 start_codon:yes stop_codon:yes gene_type:complete